MSQAQAALRHFDGTVLSKNSDSRTFRIETEQGRNVKFRVNRSTEFERIQGGFSGLHRGLRVEVDAKRTDNGLLARQVEKHNRGGGGGGRHEASRPPTIDGMPKEGIQVKKILLTGLTLALVIGGTTAVFAAVSDNPAPSHTTRTTSTAPEDVSGPCDEAEHANDPRCASGGGRHHETAGDHHGRGRDDGAEDVRDAEIGEDVPGPCDEAEHANDRALRPGRARRGRRR